MRKSSAATELLAVLAVWTWHRLFDLESTTRGSVTGRQPAGILAEGIHYFVIPDGPGSNLTRTNYSGAPAEAHNTALSTVAQVATTRDLLKPGTPV